MSNDSDNGRASASLDDAIQHLLAGGEPLTTGGLAVTETWISVDDRLPKEGVCVLVAGPSPTALGDCMEVGALIGGAWIDTHERPIDIDGVTHWRPLPEPPRAA